MFNFLTLGLFNSFNKFRYQSFTVPVLETSWFWLYMGRMMKKYSIKDQNSTF